MLWYCRYEWHPQTTREKVARRILELHEASGGHRPEILKNWYSLAGGGGGFLLVETDDPRQLTAYLQPYMDLVSFDVHAVYVQDYDERIEEYQKMLHQNA